MYRSRQLNPLGIRKLDVQKQRRAMYAESRQAASSSRQMYRSYKSSGNISDDELERLLKNAYARGWESGVTVGAQATRDRVAESLGNGTLVKAKVD